MDANRTNWQFSRRTFLRGGVAAALAGAASGASVLSACGASPKSTSSTATRPPADTGTVPPGPFNPTGARGLGPAGTLLPPGTRPFPSVAPGTDMMPQIDHVVVLMMENHSFDDHLGMLGRGDGLTLGPGGTPVNFNPDPHGGYVHSWHLPSTCQPDDNGTSQGWNASHISWDNGRNDGFVKACGSWSMGYWDQEDLPFYYAMATTFPIADRYFCSTMAQTYPNRRFLIGATALGDVSTDIEGLTLTGDFPNGTIFDRLWQYGITWKDYYPEVPTAAMVFPTFQKMQAEGNHGNLAQFQADCASGNLPSFSIVDPYVEYSEENGDISTGEGYAAAVIEAVLASPSWPKIALLWTYDEHGGYYDHVPPVPAILPDTVPPDYAHDGPPDIPGTYAYTGFRVPFAAVSPWAKKDHVSHVVYDHTSILKFVETKWNLPAMTYRDANAHNLLDLFDFSATKPPFAEPPRLPKALNPFTGAPRTICQDGKLAQYGRQVRAAHWDKIPDGTRDLLAAHARAHSY